MTLPENRKPLLWQDMPFADRPKGHPSTERLEIQKLQERVAELEAALEEAAQALDDYSPLTGRSVETSDSRAARAALKRKDHE